MVHAGSSDSDAIFHPGGPGASEDVSNHTRASMPPSADALPAPGPRAVSPETMPAERAFGKPTGCGPSISGIPAVGQLQEPVPVLGLGLGRGMGLASSLFPAQELPLSTTPALQASGWPPSATASGVQEATGPTADAAAVCLPLSGRAEQAGAGVGVDAGTGGGVYGGEGYFPVQLPGSYRSVSLDVPLPDNESGKEAVRRSVPEHRQQLQLQTSGQGHRHVAEGAAVAGAPGGTIGSGQLKGSGPPSKLPSPPVSGGGRAAAGAGEEGYAGGDEREDDARSGRERDTGAVLRQEAAGDPEAESEWRRELPAASARSVTGAGVLVPPPWTRSWSAGAAAGAGRSPGAGSGPVPFEASDGGGYRVHALQGGQGVGGGWRSVERARDGGAVAPGAACASPTNALQQLQSQQQPHTAARRRPVRVLSLHKAAHQLLPLPAANPAPAAPGPAEQTDAPGLHALPHQHTHPAQTLLELNNHLQHQELLPPPQQQQYHLQQQQQPSLLAVIPYDALVNVNASVDSSAPSGAAASATLAWALPHPTLSSAELANSSGSGLGPQAAASRVPSTTPHFVAPSSTAAVPAEAFSQPILQAWRQDGGQPGTQAPYHQPGPTPAPASAPASGQYVPRRLARSYLPSRLQQQAPSAPAATQVQLPPALGAPSAPTPAMHPEPSQAEARPLPGPTQPGPVLALAGTLQAAHGAAGITPMQELLARASAAAQTQPPAVTAPLPVSFARSSYGSAGAPAPGAPAVAAAPGVNFGRLSHGSASAAPAGPRTLSDYVIPEEEPQQYTVMETVQMMRVLSRARGAHLSSRMRRVRVTAKIASAHPESLPADLPASLSRALMAADTGAPGGAGGMGGGASAGVWLLTGLAARRGCVELVVDLALYMPRGALHMAGDALGGRMVAPGNAWQLQGSRRGQGYEEQASGSSVDSMRSARGSGAASAFRIQQAAAASRSLAAPLSTGAAARLLASQFVGHSPSPSSSSSSNSSTVHSSGGSQGPRELQYQRWEGEGAEQLRAEHMPSGLTARRDVPAVLLLPPGTQPQPGVPGAGLLTAQGAVPGAVALAASQVLRPECGEGGEGEWIAGQCGGVPGTLLRALEQCGVPLDDGEEPCVNTQVGCGWPQPVAGTNPTRASSTDAAERTCTAPDVAEAAEAEAEGSGVAPPTLWLPRPVGVLPHGVQQLRMVQVVVAGGSAGPGAQRGFTDTIRVRTAATYLDTHVAYHAQLTVERDPRGPDSGARAGAGAERSAEDGGDLVAAEWSGCSVFTVDVHGSLPRQGGLLLFESCRTVAGDGAAAATALPAMGAPAPFLVLPEGEEAAAAELSRLRAVMRRLHQLVAPEGEVTQAELAAEAEMAAQQLLVDLGMLLDAAAAAAPAAPVVTIRLSSTPQSPQLVGGPHGGSTQPDAAAAAAAAAVAATFPASFSAPSPSCPATTSSATCSTTAADADATPSCEEFLVDLTTGVRELWRDALCLLSEPTAGGCGLPAEQQGPYADHLQDVACTLLAACAEVHMPHTAQLVLQAACARLRLVTPEALLAGAEVDPRVGGQLLAAYRAAAEKPGGALVGAEGPGQPAKAAVGEGNAEAPLAAVAAVPQAVGAQGGEGAAAGGSSGAHLGSGAPAEEVHPRRSGSLQRADDAVVDGDAAGTSAAGAEAAGSGALVNMHAAVRGSLDVRPGGTAALGHRRQWRLWCLGLGAGPQEQRQGREGEEERYLQFVADRNWALLR